MADLATLGFSVDSAQVVDANKALGDFSASGKSAQVSADVLTAAAVRLGISVDEVQRRLDAANDNLAANTDQMMSLAAATKQASAANDNFSGSITSAGTATVAAGGGFFSTIEHAVSLAAALKLLGAAALFISPAARSLAYSWTIGPVLSAAGTAVLSFLSIVARLTPAALLIAGTFELLNYTWKLGTDLLNQYANSLDKLYSPEMAQNLKKLTAGQTDVISAEQVSRATELGVRLQDAQFTIDQMLKLSFDLTDPALKLQAAWVMIKEAVAGLLVYLNSSNDKLNIFEATANRIGNLSVCDKISGRDPNATALPDLSFAGESDKSQSDTASIAAATGKLSAMMGVANLASEALAKTNKAAGDLDKELGIGDSFVARYSDDIKKLADGVADHDSWDRVAASIDRTTARLEANAATVGKSVQFQESLRVEMQLLASTAGGLNAVTDKQTDLFVDLRTQGFTPLEAALTAGIKLDNDRAESLAKLGKAAGDAQLDIQQQAAAIANEKALQSDEYATQALTAYSAAQKGVVAALQKQLELRADVKKGILDQKDADERAASASKLASDTELKQLSEAARARALAATQTAATTQVSIAAAGLEVGAAYKLTTIEQTRQQLETDASSRHTTINQKELQALTDKINKTGDLKQIEAQAAAQRTADFDQQTALLSTVDQQIAAVQQKLHGDGWKAFMDDGLAAQMRITDAMKQIGSAIETNVTNSLTDIAQGAVSVGQGFANMGQAIVKSLEQAIIKLAIVEPLMKSLQSSFKGSGLADLLGIGDADPGSKANPLAGLTADDYEAKGNAFGYGNIIPFKKGGSFTNSVVDSPTLFKFAGGAGMMGEAGPEAIMPLKRGSDGSLGVSGGGSQVIVNVNVDNSTDSNVGVSQQKNSSGGVDLKVMIRQAVGSDISQGYHDKALKGRYGVSAAGGKR